MVSGISGAVAAALIYSIAFPIGMVIWWKKRSGADLWCFIVGAICFTLSVMVLERMVHGIFLTGNNKISEMILSSPVLYTLYACLAAGLFEETARLFGFKVLLRKYNGNECAVAYGIGHGGCEVLILLAVNYLILALAQAGVMIGTEEITAQLLAAAGQITLPTAGIAMFERISAMMIQIGLSMVVFEASRKKGKLWLYPAAILLHALADAPAALYQFGVIHSIPVVEIIAFAAGLLCLYIGKKVLGKRMETIGEE